jgi:hypothetical protein
LPFQFKNVQVAKIITDHVKYSSSSVKKNKEVSFKKIWDRIVKLGLFFILLSDGSDSQVPFSAPPFSSDSDYPMDSCRISKPRRVSLMVMISTIYLLFQYFKKTI